MSRSVVRWSLALWTASASALSPSLSFPATPAAPSADSLYRRALERLGRGTPDQCRMALSDLDEASRRTHEGPRIPTAVARTYAALGHHARARACLDRITRLTPDDAEAQFRLGLLWKWEWLASLESSSYAKALRHLMEAARLDARNLEARLALTALALAKNNARLGMLAARSAVACDPGAVESGLALGCASYRAGELGRADSALRAVIPRLPPGLRARFTDLSTISAGPAPERDVEPEADAAMYWRDLDPDLTTPENEARVDFLARVAHAALLFRDDGKVRWDLRAELLARYGVPSRIELPPPPDADEDVFTYLTYFPFHITLQGNELVTVGFPYHKQTWLYPELGLRADLWDRMLSESYTLPVAMEYDADPRPSPAMLAERPDLLVLDDGRGVFRALPPGVTSMPARAMVSQFPADSGTRLVAHVETQGSPSDSLFGSWVVVGADGQSLIRAQGLLSISACDPARRRIAQFDAVVPPGVYRTHLAVEDRHGRRGVVRLETRVPAVTAQLVVSDLVLVCAAPLEAGPIQPNFERHVHDARNVSVYFEVDHLSLDPEGIARFRYRYAVRQVDRDGQPIQGAEPVFEAAREEENVGAHRRQFVNAPIPSLAPGAYQFEIELRDLRSGAVATRAVSLVKD